MTAAAEMPDDIRRSSIEWMVKCYHSETQTWLDVRDVIAGAILAERQRCADIAERMKVKHGSPIMGPYENGQWDQGQRIASLIKAEFPASAKGGA